jgi:hypothetical protein
MVNSSRTAIHEFFMGALIIGSPPIPGVDIATYTVAASWSNARPSAIHCSQPLGKQQ